MDKDKATELQEKIDRILWGKSMVDVEDGQGQTLPFILRSLTIQETNRLDHACRRELAEALRRGMLREDDLRQLYAAQGLWTADDDVYLRGLEKKVKILKDQVKQFQFLKARLRKAQKELEQATEELRERTIYRDGLLMLSAENRAEEVRRRHMVFMITEDIDEQPHWPSMEAFLGEDDLALVYNLAIAYFRNNVFDQKETREIARSGLWRFRWNASKNGADLFGQPIPNWSEAQNALVYWSQHYDFVYESMDKPPDSVIEDDAACDAWYDEQAKKLARKGDEQKNILGTKKAKTTKFHQEQFVMVDEGDAEAVDEIQSMNPESVRQKLRAENEEIKKAGGRVSEWKLRRAEHAKGKA